MREFNRKMARQAYTKFSQAWRSDLRNVGRYGQPGNTKKPTFNMWFKMHQGNVEHMRQSTPSDVLEYLHAALHPETQFDQGQFLPVREHAVETERGATTIDVLGDDEESKL